MAVECDDTAVLVGAIELAEASRAAGGYAAYCGGCWDSPPGAVELIAVELELGGPPPP